LGLFNSGQGVPVLKYLFVVSGVFEGWEHGKTIWIFAVLRVVAGLRALMP